MVNYPGLCPGLFFELIQAPGLPGILTEKRDIILGAAVIDQLKEELADAARHLHEAGFVLPLEGNLSIRIPGEDAMVITPTANRYSGLAASDMAVVGFDGRIDEARSGERGPSSEYRIHAAILNRRPRAGAVVHVHPPETTAHAVWGREIPVIVEETAILLGGPVPCAPYRRTGTPELVEALVEGLGSGNAVMLANHGLLTCGRTLGNAVDAAMVIEKLAGIHRRALELGAGKPPGIPEADAEILQGVFRVRFSTD